MKTISIMLLLLTFSLAQSQNLVQNYILSMKGSGANACHIDAGISYFKGWVRHCAINGNTNTPSGGLSLIGSSKSWLPGIGQNPLPLSGTGYMSCVIIIDSTHLNAGGISQLSLHRNTLTDTLLKDTTYCVETHVRAWNGKVTGFWSCETHDKLGFYFTDQDSLPSPYPWRDGIVPQVWNNTGYIDNLTHWRPVRGKFVASGGEQ